MRPRMFSACTALALMCLLFLSPLGAEIVHAQATSITSTGFRANEGGGGALSTVWTTGNLGNTWAEGEWVPYQLIISDVQTNFPGMADFPDIVMEYDFTAQNDARFVDLVRSIQAGTTQLTDAQGWPQDDGTPYAMGTRTQIENAQNDVGNAQPLENSWTGFSALNLPNSQVNRSSPPGFDIGTTTDQFRYFYITRQDLIDAGIDTTTNTIIIYYQLHESRSFIWSNSLQSGYDQSPTDDWGGYVYSLPGFDTDVRNGSGFVPGSSGQLRVSFGGGDKTVPIPIPERLPGSVSGLKWHDVDGDGILDGGEDLLSGWRIYVSGSLEGILFSTSTLTDGSGDYSFPNLTSNVDWSIFEAAQQEVPATIGWDQTYPSAGTIVGVGTGTDFGFNSDTANVGWLVSLTKDINDQPDMNFGNRQCELAIVCPSDADVECDGATDPSVTGYPVITGNCGPFDTVFTDNVLQGVCGVDGFVSQIERTWIVTDAVGNADTCLQVITQVDTTPPILPSPPADVTLECDADLSPPQLGPPTDNCDPDPTIGVRQDTIPGDCPQSFTLVNTWIAVDACGNSDSVKQTITVDDTTPPVLSGVPSDITVECTAPAPPTVTATDNCDADVPVILTVETVGSCPATMTRTWTATDECGNSVQLSQVITIIDTTPPVISGAPGDASLECSDPFPDTATVTASDNCDPNPSLDFSETITPGTCADEFTITRVWTATDSCGNEATAQQVIEVQDNTAPVIACPQDLDFECDDIGDFGFPTATDNCDPDPAITMIGRDSTAGDCDQAYTLVFTYEATDRCGNADTCAQTITVVDTTPPVIACPDDLNFECDAVGDFGFPTATDNCTNEPAISEIARDSTPGDCPQEYTLVLTYEATDDCGNSAQCQQTITVVDTTPPVIACPGDINANCDDIPGFGQATAQDNCDPDPSIDFSDDTLTTTCPLEIARTWTATDACGNSSSCVQSIIVDDTTPPVIACPEDKRFECDAVGDFGFPTATDNCTTEPAISMIGRDSTAGDCAAAYTLVLTYEAVDACGNADTCAQTITVVDETPPVIACPDNLEFECDNVGDFGFPTATDNCDPDPAISMISRDSTAGDCAYAYSLVLTYEAMDACGNADTCAQTITVVDTTPPVIACPDDLDFECDALGDFGFPTATDNCDPDPAIAMIDRDSTAGDCPQAYTLVLTYEAADDCGNTDTCSQTITVEDTTPPVIACPSDIDANCDDIPGFGSATATDNCDPDPQVRSEDDTLTTTCPLEIARTWIAEDACGNADTCVQTIIVDDTTPPVIACPADKRFECDAVGDFGFPTATDNCDADPAISMIDRDSTSTCPQGYVLVLTYEALDDCGNADTCSQTITVEDNDAPVLTCAADGTVDCDQPVIFTPPTVTDNCDPAPAVNVVSTDTVPGPALGEFTHTRTWIALDACGNQSFTCDQSIIVLPCPDSGCTFTMGGWGSKCPPGQQGNPNSTQPGCIRDNFFAQVFPGGVTIGDASGYTATWNSAAAVQDYLPAGGTPRPLSQNYTDPTSTSAGVLGGQILALTLNVEYSCAGVFNTLGIADPGFCYASYTIPEFCGKFAGIRVDSFLVIANLVLSGDNGAADGYGAQWSDINYTATCLNELLNDCDPSAPDVSLVDLAKAGLVLGDVNYSGKLSAADLVYLAQFVFKGGAAPNPMVEVGDVDWNGEVGSRDVIYLADWLLKQPILSRTMDDAPEPDIR